MTGGRVQDPSAPVPTSTVYLTPEFVTDDAMRRNLRADFPPDQLTHVDKGYGVIDAINHAHVVNRLNEAAPGWDYGITEFTVVHGAMVDSGAVKNGRPVLRFQLDPGGMPHLVAIYGWFQVGGVTRWECGEVENITTYGDELKKAISDFIKRGAMRFGVGIQLWAKEELAGTTAAPAAPQQVAPGSSPSPATEPAPATGGAASVAVSPSDGASGGAVPPTTAGGVGDPAAAQRMGKAQRPLAVEPTAPAAPPDPTAGPDDWARAARELHTTRTQAQVQVVEFLKVAQTHVRQPSDVTVDLLNFALGGIVIGKVAAP